MGPLFYMSREDYIMEFDELHLLGSRLIEESPDEAVRILEDLFIHAYLMGRKHTGEELDLDEGDWAYFDELMLEQAAAEKMKDEIYRRFDDKDFADRVREYILAGDLARLNVVIATEFHRDYNAGGDSMAQDYSKHKKRLSTKMWQTMQDLKVRDTHEYLQDRVVPIDEDFYTYDGDYAPYPGAFQKVENNANCRCWLTYSA